MFIGHFAVGLAAKKLNSKPSLGTYFLAAQFLDLLWPSLLLLNVEKVAINHDTAAPVPLTFTHYPVSHSLLAVAGWAVLAGGLYFLARKDKRAAFIVGLCVISHWFLDLLVHLPDLPLYPGNSPEYGLGLWKMKGPEMALEMILFLAGAVLYWSATKAKNKTGIYATAALLLFLLVIFLLNEFGSPPPDVKTVAWAGQLQWLIVLWAYWADRNRVARKAPLPGSKATLRTFVQHRPLEKP
jgi:hypothetical protein